MRIMDSGLNAEQALDRYAEYTKKESKQPSPFHIKEKFIIQTNGDSFSIIRIRRCTSWLWKIFNLFIFHTCDQKSIDKLRIYKQLRDALPSSKKAASAMEFFLNKTHLNFPVIEQESVAEETPAEKAWQTRSSGRDAPHTALQPSIFQSAAKSLQSPTTPHMTELQLAVGARKTKAENKKQFSEAGSRVEKSAMVNSDRETSVQVEWCSPVMQELAGRLQAQKGSETTQGERPFEEKAPPTEQEVKESKQALLEEPFNLSLSDYLELQRVFTGPKHPIAEHIKKLYPGSHLEVFCKDRYEPAFIDDLVRKINASLPEGEKIEKASLKLPERSLATREQLSQPEEVKAEKVENTEKEITLTDLIDFSLDQYKAVRLVLKGPYAPKYFDPLFSTT